MYSIIYKDGRQMEISDMKAERIILFSKQSLLSPQQQEWFTIVEGIDKIRDPIDQHMLHFTTGKVVVETCQYNKHHWF